MSQNRIDVLSRGIADGPSRRNLLRMLGIGAAGTAIAGTAVSRIGLGDART